MRLLIFIFLSSFCCWHYNETATEEAIQIAEKNKVSDWKIQLKPTNKNYQAIVDSIQKINLKSVSNKSELFTELMLNKIIPYWYGTKWDFNGHTNIPNSGEIACGYFVSTTLKHIGININRYKLAQQSALSEIKTLALGEKIHQLYNVEVKEVVDYLKSNCQSGIFVVGLDNHVGYLLLRKEQVFFIHSNYLSPSEVIIEEALKSNALAAISSYYFSSLSHNKGFIDSWSNKTTFNIIYD